MQSKKYLTKVTEDQWERIKQAAEEIQVTQPEIVQTALDRFFSQDWSMLKLEIAEKKRKARIEELDRKIAELCRARDEVAVTA